MFRITEFHPALRFQLIVQMAAKRDADSLSQIQSPGEKQSPLAVDCPAERFGGGRPARDSLMSRSGIRQRKECSFELAIHPALAPQVRMGSNSDQSALMNDPDPIRHFFGDTELVG